MIVAHVARRLAEERTIQLVKKVLQANQIFCRADNSPLAKLRDGLSLVSPVCLLDWDAIFVHDNPFPGYRYLPFEPP